MSSLQYVLFESSQFLSDLHQMWLITRQKRTFCKRGDWLPILQIYSFVSSSIHIFKIKSVSEKLKTDVY